MFGPDDEYNFATSQPSLPATLLGVGILTLPLLIASVAMLAGRTFWSFLVPWSTSAMRLTMTVAIAAVMIGLAVLERRSTD